MPKKVETAVKAPKKTVTKKVEKVEAVITAPIAVEKKSTGKSSLSAPVYSLAGIESGKMSLPASLFGVEINTALLAQAMRVYFTNEQSHWSNTKTRGQVRGSTRKIWKQKGTGRARHGAITAPIFVGGGIALGPKARKTTLDLPKKMKKQALISALSQKQSESEIFGLDTIAGATGKTKEMATFVKTLNKRSVLIVADAGNDNVFRATRNLKGLDFLSVDQLNAFEVINHQSILLTKEAVDILIKKVEKETK